MSHARWYVKDRSTSSHCPFSIARTVIHPSTGNTVDFEGNYCGVWCPHFHFHEASGPIGSDMESPAYATITCSGMEVCIHLEVKQ